MTDIIERLRIESRREPHEPIWRDAIDEIEALRAEGERDEALLRQVLETLGGLFGVPDQWTGAGAGGVAVWRLGGADSVLAAITALRERLASGHECADTIRALLAERDALRDALSEALTRIAAIGYPASPDGEYSEDGEWTFSDAVPRAVDAEEVKAAFLVIRAALRERLGKGMEQKV